MSTYTLDDLLMEAYLLGQDLWHDDNAMWKPTGALLIDLAYSLQCYMDNENV